MSTPDVDTCKYKPVRCYQCGETMRAYTFSDTWKMQVDGKLHPIPLFAIPCHKCDSCAISVVDGSSDEQIMWCYKKYLDDNGLNTTYLQIRRWIRRRILRVRDRWNYWVFKTFYKKEG